MATTLLAQTATETTTKKKAKKPAARATVTAQDVQALKDALAAQQQQIQQLRDEMHNRESALQEAQQQAQQAQQQLQQAQSAAASAQQKADAASATADQQKESVEKLNSQLTDVQTTLTNTAINTQDDQKRFSALESLLGRFRFTGDVRIRGENFFQDESGFRDRNRIRVRVRLGIEGKLNEDFIGGLALATGSQADPTTTNETFNNFFTRKTFALDRGYITYNPIAHKWLSLTGGKFAYQWQRTSVTGDPDLNPEGFNQKLSWDIKNRVVKNVTLQGIQEIFSEVGSGTDSYALGGQASSKLQFGPWTAIPSFLALKWQGTSAILNVPVTNGVTPSSFNQEGTNTCVTGVQGAPPKNPTTGFFSTCAFAPNGMTNAVFTDSKGKPAFLSGFFYADFILNNTIKTGINRLPLNLLLEFEDNLDAAAHPLDRSNRVLTNLGSQNKEYGADISLGQTKNKNDIQFGYAWLRQEQDSVLASFAESDQRTPTNLIQNRVYANWKLRANTLASFTWWHGRVLNSYLQNNAAVNSVVSAGQVEPSLNRFQFDLVYSF
jgi:hypothetical protein